MTAWTVAVVVPAHDEAERIEACVRSVLAARLPAGSARFVVVVADRCADGTAAVAQRGMGGHGTVVEVDVGCVGAARRIGASTALERCTAQGLRRDRTWLLSTDADSVVSPAWIEAHLGLAEAGVLAVAGTVAVDSFDGHRAQVPARFARRYLVAADGTHGHVHGTNLGVRADRYQQAGGWHDLATAEDHDLWDRISALGGPVASTSVAPVVTSGRLVGRAPHGFASLLVDLGLGVGVSVAPLVDSGAEPLGDESVGASA